MGTIQHQAYKASISKYNSKRENQVNLLMITDNEKKHYLVIKSVSKLLNGITSNHKGDFYYLNCFHSYRTKNKLKNHDKICKNHDFCNVKMPDFKTQSRKKIIKTSFD